MKLSFLKPIALSLITVFALNSCRNDEAPADIHNHDEVQYLTVKLTNQADSTEVQTSTFKAGGADQLITLKNGAVYNVELSLSEPHGDHTHDVTDEIIEEKEEHFFTYRFANVQVKVKRTDLAETTRKDGTKVGLKTQWTVVSAPEKGAKVNVILHHKPASVTVADAQGDEAGTAKGGEEDIDAIFDVKTK